MKTPPAGPKTKRTFVQELMTKPTPPGGNMPAQGSKRFTWSAAIVDPQVGKAHSFTNVTKDAPKPKATGTFAPASETLRDTRRFVAQARKAKKVRS